MVKFDVFDIQLAKSGPFLSGEVLAGDLLLRSKKERSIARIVIHLHGGGRVEFVEAGPGASQAQAGPAPSSPAAYQDSQTYLRYSQVLLDRSTLAKGQLRRLNFELRLPERLPSSFMTVVTYSITALVDRGVNEKSCSLTLPIIVIGDVDLNRLLTPGCDDLWRPIEAWGHWRWCQQQQQQQPLKQQLLDGIGLATVRLLADKRGFAIGESIGLSVEVRNNTKLRLELVCVCLTQKAVFRAAAADGVLARREQRLAVQYRRLQERLKPGASLLEDGVQLPVPWLATAVAAGCRLLRISYYLQVVCSVTPALSPVTGLESPVQTLHMGPKFEKTEQVLVLLEEPVTIGTKPLVAAAAASDATAAAAPAVRVAPARPSAPPPAPSEFLNDLTMFTIAPSAPPSYEESLAAMRQLDWGDDAK